MAAGKNVHEFNELNFDQEVLQSDVPVLVDFSATWCGPCKAIAPLVGQLADEYAGKIKVGTLDIDEAQGVAQRFGIRGVPTLYVFKGGEVVGKLVGAAPKQNIAALMQRAL
jgi:thioredoxin 1